MSGRESVSGRQVHRLLRLFPFKNPFDMLLLLLFLRPCGAVKWPLLSLIDWWQDSRLEGGYESVPTRDIHMKQIGLEEGWLYFLKQYVSPLQQRVFEGYWNDVSHPRRSLFLSLNPLLPRLRFAFGLFLFPSCSFPLPRLRFEGSTLSSFLFCFWLPPQTSFFFCGGPPFDTYWKRGAT